MKTFDLIVLGGGRASHLAVKAGKAGWSVALIEKSALGGTCPNRGCVPSKLLIGYANVARAIKDASRHFIKASIEDIDVEKIFEETNKYILSIDSSYESKFNENVEIFRGEGKFISDNVIEVNAQKLTAKKIVIATGARPNEPYHVKAWTSDDLFPLERKIPKSITIVGSGFVACELANFFDAIGIETKLLVRSQTLLSHEDSEISEIFKNEFSKNVDIAFETTIETIEYKDGMFHMSLVDKSANTSEHSSEAVLYATGRKSNADKLGLENTTIEVDKRGYIKQDAFFETTAKGVYVVGDASGIHMLQHAASYEVNHLGKVLLEEWKEPLVFKYMPHAVFTDPEIASVGMSEESAKKSGVAYVTCTTNWLASAKAMSLRITYPITKLIVNPNTYEILGAHLIGPDSATMMHQILAIMHIDNDIRHLKEMLYIHPALSEALLPAAVKAVGKVNKYRESR